MASGPGWMSSSTGWAVSGGLLSSLCPVHSGGCCGLGDVFFPFFPLSMMMSRSGVVVPQCLALIFFSFIKTCYGRYCTSFCTEVRGARGQCAQPHGPPSSIVFLLLSPAPSPGILEAGPRYPLRGPVAHASSFWEQPLSLPPFASGRTLPVPGL